MYTTSRTAYKQLLPGISLGLSVFLGLMILGGLPKVGFHFINYQWNFFGYAMLLSLANFVLRFWKRQYYYSKTGVNRLSLWKSFRLYLASFPLSAIPINISESFKGIWLSKTSGVPVERSISIYLVDHMFDAVSVFFLLTFGTIAYPELWPLFLIILLLFIVVIFLLKVRPAVPALIHFSSKVPLLDNFLPMFRKCINLNPYLFKGDSITVNLILGTLSWLSQGMVLYLILLGLGLTSSWQLVGISILVFSFAIIVGMISNIPGGIGAVEISLAAFLIVLLGFYPEFAVVATILFRIATFWTGFMIGLIMWVFSSKFLGINPKEGRIIDR